MEQRKFEAQAGEETLSIKILGNAMKPSFVFLHGAGIGKKERIETISESLVSVGVSVLSFDFSGQGESSGKISESSLSKRVDEAYAVITKHADLNNLTICGASIGCYVAIKLTEKLDVRNLILFYPSIYTTSA